MSNEKTNPASCQTAVTRSFNEDVLYGIWERMYERYQMIRDKMHDSENPIEKQTLLFAANLLADICNEVGDILEP
jgi:hypothetical protein